MAILECRGLCKSYGAEPALDRVDLAVEPGRCSCWTFSSIFTTTLTAPPPCR